MLVSIKTLTIAAALVSAAYGENFFDAAKETRAAYKSALTDMIEEGEL